MDGRVQESCVLFYNVSKKSNVGPIVRSAGAFGVSRILLVGDARSKVKFGAQGTHTRIPIEYHGSLGSAVDDAKAKGFRVYGVEIDPAARAIDEQPFRDDKICFIFGNEGSGLTDKAKAACDCFVRIKQFAARVESLNVAVAAGIVLHQWALWAQLPEIEFQNSKYRVEHDFAILIGTYSTTMGHVEGKGKGVYRAMVNPHTGLLTRLELLVELVDASYVETVGEESFVAVSESYGEMILASLAGEVKQTLANVGKWPCHIGVDREEDLVTVSGYGGTLARFRLADGALVEGQSVVHAPPFLAGSMADPARQAAPHAHCYVPFDNETGVCVDLGADALIAYDSKSLFPVAKDPILRIPGGPRHVAKHPGLEHIGYVVTEFTNMVVRFALEPSGGWKLFESLSTLPPGVTGTSYVAGIVVHPSGEFLFVSNRVHDSITSFRLAPADGALSFLANTPCGGACPRDITLSPFGGRLLIVANQNSSNVSVFLVGRDGVLTPTNQKFPVPTPACIKCFEVD